MERAAYLPALAIQDSDVLDRPRHSVMVRVTHWIHTLSFFALVVSGVAILIAHPRLYWGETGAVGTPSLLDLPIPFVLGHSGWGRYLHFLAAWVSVLSGLVYALSGLFTQHFRKHLFPSKADLAWGSVRRVVSNHLRLKRPREEESHSYNILQRLAYLAVVLRVVPSGYCDWIRHVSRHCLRCPHTRNCLWRSPICAHHAFCRGESPGSLPYRACRNGGSRWIH